VSRPPTAVLHVRGLHFAYPTRRLFNGVTCHFGAGLTWVRGANGAGKSTFIKLLAGALPPGGGSLSVDGTDERSDPMAYRRKVFWCGPGPVPFDHLTPHEYLGFIRGLYPGFDEASALRHARGFGLLPHWRRPLAGLSSGTQRKVWLTAAMAVGSAAVLLDEPLNALDLPSKAYFMEALGGQIRAHGQAWIVVSHEEWPLDGLPSATFTVTG
jgi:ABC-type multidrug transport system ATPase subunit